MVLSKGANGLAELDRTGLASPDDIDDGVGQAHQ
jgi:hypothetical protein